MVFGWQALGVPNFIIGLVIILIVYGLLCFCISKVVRRKSGLIIAIVAFVLTLIAYIFYTEVGIIIISSLFAATMSVYGFANLGDLRYFIANPFRKTTAKSANFGIEKIYDRETLYKHLETAVIQLSKTRTGAIITFEKNTSLKDIMKNGVPVHAPVSSELLLTIFYPGTRLHDGAVVIRRDQIAAASVYYTPTTKPLTGKFGSRHRAAIGISDVSDSVTVVVSEETGRISLAVAGELIHVTPDSFMRVLEDYMFAENSKAE